MQPDEFPRLLRVLENQKGSFDPQLVMYDNVFRSEYLHFGYWPPEDAKETDLLSDFRLAQERFADELLACLPAGSQRVLDVGAGLGRLSGEMACRGHSVTAVTPCSYQAERIAANYPRVSVQHGLFQTVGQTLLPASFDVILFSESFRYMPLTQVFPLLDRLLTRNGSVLIGDWFAQNTARAGRGHDHNEAVFRRLAQGNGWTIVSERDVTANILPTVRLAHNVLCDLYLPLVGFVLAKFAQKRPTLFRFCSSWMIRWIEKKVLPQLSWRFEPTVFAAHYRYLFLVLRRTT